MKTKMISWQTARNSAVMVLALGLLVTTARADDALDLLADGLSSWQTDKPDTWVVNDGVLSPSDKPGGYIWSKEAYGDLELTLEYKTSKECNSGVFFRTDPKNAAQGGFEIQVASNDVYEGKQVVGSLYDAQAPTERAGKADGEWNTLKLSCKGSKITAVLNGKTVVEADIEQWTTANKNPDGSKNKFKTALKDLPRTGHIGLQYHGHPVWFRNIKLKKL